MRIGVTFQRIMVLCMAITALSQAQAARLADWVTIENTRYGFKIAYPASVFSRTEGTPSDEGLSLVSQDGRARLLIGAFPNIEETSLRAYRKQVLKENYGGSVLDYAPVERKGFIVSGERDGIMFYERVHFTCKGRLISSWAMIYPVAERRFYDRVVEAIAPTFKPGKGRAKSCDFGSSS